jgi:hypothetical protein
MHCADQLAVFQSDLRAALRAVGVEATMRGELSDKSVGKFPAAKKRQLPAQIVKNKWI